MKTHLRHKADHTRPQCSVLRSTINPLHITSKSELVDCVRCKWWARKNSERVVANAALIKSNSKGIE